MPYWSPLLTLVILLIIMPPELAVAGVGGRTLWQIRVPRNSPRWDQVFAIGDDGVVTFGTVGESRPAGEIHPHPGSEPTWTRWEGAPFIGIPFARVHGTTFIRTFDRNYIVGVSDQRTNVLSTFMLSTPNSEPLVAVGEDGDVFLLYQKLADHRWLPQSMVRRRGAPV